jgi:hypothetical protein
MGKPKTKKKAGRITGWLPMAGFTLAAERPGGILGITVGMTNGLFAAVAVSTPSSSEDVDDLLSDHGHKNLGKFLTLAGAERACEAFAKDWIKGTPIDRCGCEEIAG